MIFGGAPVTYPRSIIDQKLASYLPYTGGTVTGNLTVNGTLSTTLLEALSANITVIDIKQYELSGFNVAGNATVQGNVSTIGNISAAKLGAGITPSQLIHAYSPSDANTGIRAQVAGAWMEIRGNNGSGHPGIATSSGILDITSTIGGHGGTGTPLRVRQNSGPVGGSSLQTWLNSSNVTLGIVDNTGRFGIGTATPNEKLTVVGSISTIGTTDLATFQSTTTQTPNIKIIGTDRNVTLTPAANGGNGTGLTGPSFYNAVRDSSSNSVRFQAVNSNGTVTYFQLWDDNATGVLAQRSGAIPQESRIYGAYTDASNYERFFIKTNVGATSATQIGLSADGTGQNRNLELVTGGSTRMTITSAGNVGVGTTTPSSLFDIFDGSAAQKDVTLTLRNGNFGWWKITSSNANNAGFLRFSSNNSSLTPLTLDGTTGNVGIGVASPSVKLDVKSAGGGTQFAVIRSDDNTKLFEVGQKSTDFSGYLSINTGSTSKIRLEAYSSTPSYFNAGNIGIGTTTPNEKLTVSGNISASGTIYSAGSAVVVSPTIVSIQAVTSSQYSALVSAGQALSSVLYLVQDP